MKGYVTAGLTVLAGVALFEAALIPAVVVGGAAMLAPEYLPLLRRRLRPARNAEAGLRSAQPRTVPGKPDAGTPLATLAGFGVGRAIAKTITFRIIVTTLDFTTNYVVIGELTTAAGLSTFNLIAGPLFYLAHEATWNYLGPSEDVPVDVQISLPLRQGETMRVDGGRGIKISRALAKTVTYRAIATITDFTANYVVVGDAVTAAGLSAFGFVVGPFIYFGHEKIWDYYNSPADRGADLRTPPRLLPAPG
jgi:uncharacterized membrane protein